MAEEVDNTFTGLDLIRIWGRHLDLVEKWQVYNFFNSLGDLPFEDIVEIPRLEGALYGSLEFERWDLLDKITELLDDLEEIFQLAEDALGDDVVALSEEAQRRYSEFLEELDEQIKEITEFLDSLGVPDFVIERLFRRLREFRRLARAMRALVSIPARLSRYRVDLDDMGFYYRRFLDNEERLHTALGEFLDAQTATP